MASNIRTIEILEDAIRLLDQRKLPTSEEYVNCRTAEDVAEAIRTMVVRGAPAIGITAAAGIALAMRQTPLERGSEVRRRLESAMRAAGRNTTNGRQSVLGDPAHAGLC